METNEKLLLTPREVAKTLSICEKTLYSWTEPRGPIQCVRLGRAVRYAVPALEKFIAEQQQAESPIAKE